MALDSKPISHTHRQSQEEECPSHPNATNQMKGGHIVIRCRPEVGRHPQTHTHLMPISHTPLERFVDSDAFTVID